jgi:hypothetical protein
LLSAYELTGKVALLGTKNESLYQQIESNPFTSNKADRRDSTRAADGHFALDLTFAADSGRTVPASFHSSWMGVRGVDDGLLQIMDGMRISESEWLMTDILREGALACSLEEALIAVLRGQTMTH